MKNLGTDNQENIREFIINLKVLRRGKKVCPHKYLMLLSIATLLDHDNDHNNNFTFEELEPIFLDLFEVYFPNSPYYSRMLEYPFYHSQSDKFWHLKIKEGKENQFKQYQEKRLTRKRILETIKYAFLDKRTYEIFKHKETRSLLKNEVINMFNATGYSLSCITDNFSVEDLDREDLIVKESTSLYNHEQSAIEIINKAISHKGLGKSTNNSLLFDNGSNNYYEYDLILVSNSGIYVVELKHWSGHIRISPYNWTLNGTNFRNDPHKVNNYKCKILKSIYQHQFRTYPNVWVESVVVLTNPEATVEGAASPHIAVERRTSNPTFASISDFILYLNKKRDTEAKVLSEQQISNIIDFFGKLNQPRQAVKYHLPGYETVEYLSQRAECVELIARPVGSRVRGLNRFRIFRPPTQITGIEKERFIKRAYNSLNAVSQIGDHPHILKVWVIKNEDGDIIEGSDWSEVGTLRDLLERRDEPICVDDALKICQGIALALHKAHQVGVIHRAIKPEHILLMNGIPKLINFDMSYQIEENRLTLITDVSKIKDDGYIAPEILAGQDIDESTDYFSLGTIAFELLTGAKAFASTRAFVAQGGFLGIEAFKKLQSKKIPEKVIEVIKGMITAERIKRLKNGTEIIKAFSGEADNEQIMLAAGVNFRLRPGAQYDVFEIIEMVGEGSEAQIYKARTVRGKTVALKLYNKEISRDKIFKEAEITSSINSAYVVHCENKIGYWNNERFFLVLDFIEGNTMRQQIERLERPDLQLFQKVALGLMEAIKAYHEDRGDNYTLRPIVHGDIKPDNIIITQDGKPVLFDFGIAGEPRVDVFQGTASYVPPDSILGADMRYAQDSDLFSLGVTLWEWFFGTQPYSSPAIGDEPQITEEQKNLLPDEYLEWLLRAVGTEADKRFSSVEEMYSAFIAPKADSEHSQNTCLEATTCTYPDQDEPIPEQSEDIPCIGVATELEKKTINPFVYYLNTLTNVSAGNENATAEAQVKNEYFDRISVDNPLTQFVFEKLINERKNLVLTGNAGDGKTTIAAQVIEKIFGHRRQLKAVEFFPSYNVKIIKDMSEIEENERPSILREVLSDKKNAYLIVSNTGTLLQSFKAIAEQNHEMPYEALESTLLKALASDSPQHILNDRFLIVNIGNISSINTACEVFSRMLENQNWDRCDRCNGALNCPILFNVRLLQAKRVTVRARVMLLYRRLYEYNVRLTMRQMIGHLAFSITGGYTCADVNAMSHMALHNNLPSFLFHNLFFGDNGEKVSPLATQLLPVRKIRNAGFGSFLEAFSERRIWMDERINPIHLIGFPDSLREKLCNLYSLSNPDSRRQARRMLFFFGLLEEDSIGNRFISIFLDSPMLRKFIDFCDNTNKLPALEELKYRARVIQVLQEFFTGLRLPEDKWQMDELFITLNFALGRPAGSTATQIILANYRINDFELIIKTLYKVSNESRRVLCLRTKQGNLEMILDLPFLDYVARRYEGEVTGDLSQYYADRLERFKVKLLELYNKNNTNEQNLQLLAAGTDRSFRIIKITVADGNLEVM